MASPTPTSTPSWPTRSCSTPPSSARDGGRQEIVYFMLNGSPMRAGPLMERQRIRAALALVVAMLVLAACGTSLNDEQALRDRRKDGSAGQAASGTRAAADSGLALAGSEPGGGT